VVKGAPTCTYIGALGLGLRGVPGVFGGWFECLETLIWGVLASAPDPFNPFNQRKHMNVLVFSLRSRLKLKG